MCIRDSVQRHYTVPARLVKAGRNTLAIKVSDNGGEGGIAGKAEDMNLKLSDQASLSLAGSWKYRVGCSLADMPPAPIYPEHSSFPSVLFNGMVPVSYTHLDVYKRQLYVTDQ